MQRFFKYHSAWNFPPKTIERLYGAMFWCWFKILNVTAGAVTTVSPGLNYSPSVVLQSHRCTLLFIFPPGVVWNSPPGVGPWQPLSAVPVHLRKTSQLMHYTAARHTVSPIRQEPHKTLSDGFCARWNRLKAHVGGLWGPVGSSFWPLPTGWPVTGCSPAWSLFHFLCGKRLSFLAIIVLLRHKAASKRCIGLVIGWEAACLRSAVCVDSVLASFF